MIKTLRLLLRYLAHERGLAVDLYRRLCRPDGDEWAAWLARWGGLHAMGRNCSVQSNVTITDPAFVRLGNNVRLTGCALIGHDGSVNMLNRAYGLKLDRVGKIDIRDNVFIGHQAIVLPGVTIGPNAIIAAGAVVARDVPPNSVVAGVPARVVRTLEDHVAKQKAETEAMPWAHLIAAREGVFDPALEPELRRMRIDTFYGQNGNS
jgi:acetyltransferase-like isoleucine patch superfamily enzyme